MAFLNCHKCFLLFLIINTVYTERIKDMIYMPLDGVAACFRRHNGTNQFGCSSSRAGNVGVIHLIESEQELAWLERNATAGPYTAVVPMAMFTRDTLIRLRNTGNINGVLLARNISLDRPTSYSPEDTCPNRYSGLGNKNCNTEKPWNPYGSALLLEDWPFPMFYLKNQDELNQIKSCFYKFNDHDRENQNQRPLCALEMKSFMLSAVNSETCLRRSIPGINFNPPQFCDPMGDRSIHWPVGPLSNDTESVIMVITRLDAASLFDGQVPGAGSPITGLVTLLATAHYLKKMNTTVEKTNIVFSLLNGEAFDYIGSSRLVYDLKEGNFNSLGGQPLHIDKVRMVIELGQVGNGSIYLHTSNSDGDSVIDSIKENLSATLLKNSVPPASIQSFLVARPNMSATVIANHGEQFVNKYYHSILDDSKSVAFSSNETGLVAGLNKIAISLATQLYHNVTGTYPPSMNSTEMEILISSMLDCYLEDPQCALFQMVSLPNFNLPDEFNLYVGVDRWGNPATTVTRGLLAQLTGTEVPEYNSSMCNEHRYMWMRGLNSSGLCINTTTNYSSATSPAFIIPGYNMASGIYPTWTESVWQELGMRLFLKPSPATEILSITLGSTVAIASFFVVWFIKSRTDLLFEPIETADC